MKQCKHPCCGSTCRKKKTKIKAKPISKRSKKMIDQMKIYNQRRRKFLIENPICVVTGEEATEVHHAAGRIGAMLLDEKYWKPVSRNGHRMIEENPVWAKEMGYSVSRLTKKA